MRHTVWDSPSQLHLNRADVRFSLSIQRCSLLGLLTFSKAHSFRYPVSFGERLPLGVELGKSSGFKIKSN